MSGIKNNKGIAFFWLGLGLFVGLIGFHSTSGAAAGEADLNKPVNGVIVPDQFLRRWDPVTIFFDRDMGPAGGGPEDAPGKFAALSPAHPGAYTWLNGRTLQFRPAEPWPPLTRFTWRMENRTVALDTLMTAPIDSIPHNGAAGLPPVETFTLTFAEPVDPGALARMITVELRPLPGVEAGNARWLDQDSFDIKIMERRERSDRAAYVLLFHDPIPPGTRAIVHLRLSLADRVDQAFRKIAFTTAEPFQATHVGWAGQQYPVTPEGVQYTPERAIQCSARDRRVQVRFSARPGPLSPVEGRGLVRFTPSVEALAYQVSGNTLFISGRFLSDVLYQVDLTPTPIRDKKGRELYMKGPSRLHLYFPLKESYLRWKTSHGVLERFGPRLAPLEGRNFERVDVRVYAIDPLDRSFWPFPDGPVLVDDEARPPSPGEEPAPFTDPKRYISPRGLAERIKALGSPAVSTMRPIPLRKGAGAARFGLDLSPLLESVDGKNAPGAYLVGARSLDGNQQRAWIRIQVTDLCLTTVEGDHEVKFFVTSLETGLPAAGARIRVEGAHKRSGKVKWVEIVSGLTDGQGLFTYPAPGSRGYNQTYDVRRIVVEKEGDILVLDPTRAPEKFVNNHWERSGETWLQWTRRDLHYRGDRERLLCHIFTERPVYRPDEPVHIKGWIRLLSEGKFSPVVGSGHIMVRSPGDLEWRYPVEISERGSFYYKFDEPKLPTGEFHASLEFGQREYGGVSFRKEAYRLPRFEVKLHGPDRVSLDKEFTIRLHADYYAGGPAADRPVRWRVTQFPHVFRPKKLEGWFYSTDARFSGESRFRSTPAREKEERTNEGGGAEIRVDPGREPTAQPRRYVIEATVAGADDQTVSNTRQVLALPPFVLAMKVPRYIENARSIEPEILVMGADGELLPGQTVTARLLHRQWHSVLKAGDFSRGTGKYITEVVDEKIHETKVVSGDEPLSLRFDIEEAGVYLVELESHDKLGRAQVVSVDLFAGGDEPVTWSRPPARVFKATLEKKEYEPGEVATVILESPFQRARALAVIERPEGRNQYQWIDVRNGVAAFELPVKKRYMPSVPIHFILMRGRVGDRSPGIGDPDLGKPATLATTVWLKVLPVDHRVSVALTHPPKAQPGEEVDIAIALSDRRGAPLAGEVTLWLVDQAVLALGKEQRLDPLPSFIIQRKSRLTARDVRNRVIGHLPLEELPGGDEGEPEKKGLLDKITPRKDFRPVPYYNPSIIVGEDGAARVTVKLPDNLTNFKIRAKVVSGPDRFGFGKGMLSVRLPVIVQPSLPRFVRPGDRFTAMAIGRVVEGEGGPGAASVRLEGLDLEESDRKEFQWILNRAQRIEYAVSVPTPPYDDDGRLSRKEVAVTMGVERVGDKARDGFTVTLPIRPDRGPVIERVMADLAPDAPLILPAVTDPTRPGTLKREILVSSQPALIRMAAGLSYLMKYPHGCTEQRISRARARIAMRRFRDALHQQGGEDDLAQGVDQVLKWIAAVEDGNGLAAYWPGTGGHVSLTAWVVQFMVEARAAGFGIDEALFDAFTDALTKSLRTDYSHYITGCRWAERSWALTALAAAGRADAAYAAELARKADYLDLESKAQVALALHRTDPGATGVIQDLSRRLWKDIVIRLYQGREMYGGLQENAISRVSLILPSETRSISEALRAVSAISPDDDAHRNLLRDALITLGRGDGWGDTNASAAALLALTEFIGAPPGDPGKQVVNVAADQDLRKLLLDKDHPMKRIVGAFAAETRISLEEKGRGGALIVRTETSYTPAADGAAVKAHARGFVVDREMLLIQQEDAPSERLKLDAPDKTISLMVGDVIEEHIELVNPEDRSYVAVVIPLAAGMETMNPSLATAPAEAKPDGRLTLAPSYTAYMDDRTTFYYNTLPKGAYHFYFRARASIPGRFIQPPARAEMMYDMAVNGNGNGARVEIQERESDLK